MKTIILILLLGSSLLPAQENKQPVLSVGDPAPAFSLPDMDNNYVFLKDFSGEKLRKPWRNKVHHVVVISFFATWCGPCKKEIPHLNKLQADFKGQDVKFFLIDVGETREKVAKFLETFRVDMPVLLDRYKQTSEKYEANSLPRLLVIDKKGIIRKINHGFKDAARFEKDMRELITRLLAG